MNAGGSVFWVALAIALSLAGGATWLFLTPAADGASEVAESFNPVDSAEVTLEEAVEAVTTSSEEEDLGEEADVTFSFAKPVAALPSGRLLEQDDLHLVTCRSASGERLWEYRLSDTLIQAFELDANDDGAFECLLVDSKQGVGLDQHGQPIPGFSINPSASISCVAVVDYDGDGNERYLFGLGDGRVLNYRKLGEPTPGWKHVSKGAAVQAIAHLRAGRKDYICTVDEAGVVMLLKRNGDRRLRTPVQLHPKSGQRAVAFDIRSDIESSAIISRNPDGSAASRQFGDGVPRTASNAEAQILETEERRLVGPE